MTRNIKALGLVLVVVLGLSAVVTAGASAQTEDMFRTTAGQTAHLTAEPEGLPQIRWNTTDELRYVNCSKGSLGGTVQDGAKELTLTPSFSGCLVMTTEQGGGTGEGAGFLEFNGCDYRFTGITTSGNPTEGSHANMDIVCPEGKELEIKVTALKLKCATVPPQQITHAVRYDTEETAGKTDIKITVTSHNLESITPNTAMCPTKSGKAETHTNGTYTGTFRVAGFKDAAHTEPTSISVE